MSTDTAPDMEKFRLRPLVERLIDLGEVEIHDQPVPLSDLSTIIEASDKAVLFRKAGPEQVELVGSVAGSRTRVAAAFGVAPGDLIGELQSRLGNPQPVVEVGSGEAPVQQVVLEGEEADLSKLPFHPQHQFDGGTYISSAIDFSVDPETGRTNVGCRRLSLRGRGEAMTNLTAPSDLREIYKGCIERGETLTVNFAVGSHTLDIMASCMKVPTDEDTLLGTLRGEPMPMVKAVSNDLRVPADAEMIIEGYLEETGYIQPEGPFGEYMGYYGPMHQDPIYHVTAITMRRDPLHQTLLHGCGNALQMAESVNLTAIITEARLSGILASMGIEVTAIRAMLSTGEGQHVRIAIRQSEPGQARAAIKAVFEAARLYKHVFIVDEDVDIFSEDQFEWAMATRFQADRDLEILTGELCMPMDPSLDGRETGAKAGFDMTVTFERKDEFLLKITQPPKITPAARYQTVRQALESGPKFFTEIMELLGSQDGREIALELDELRAGGQMQRLENGEFSLPD